MKRIFTKFISALLITILAIFSLAGCDSDSTTKEASNDALVVAITAAENRDLSKTITLGGLLSPESEITLMAGGQGSKVTDIFVSVGDEVKKGDILLAQDMSSIYKQQETLLMSIEQMEETMALQQELNEMGAVSDMDIDSMELQLQQLYVQLDTLNDSIDLMTVSSPIDGIVSYLPLSEGQLAAASMVAATVVNIDTLKLSVSVGESNITGIHKDDELSVYIPTLDKSFDGVVDSVPPTVNAQTKSYLVGITIDNPDHEILGGMYGEIELLVESHTDALAVKAKSVVTVNDESCVFVVEGDKAIAKPVETGAKVGDYIEILSGINLGDKVVSQGQYTCYDGATVTIVEGK